MLKQLYAIRILHASKILAVGYMNLKKNQPSTFVRHCGSQSYGPSTRLNTKRMNWISWKDDGAEYVTKPLYLSGCQGTLDCSWVFACHAGAPAGASWDYGTA